MPGHRLFLRPMSKPGGALPARYEHCCICACPCSARYEPLRTVGPEPLHPHVCGPHVALEVAEKTYIYRLNHLKKIYSTLSEQFKKVVRLLTCTLYQFNHLDIQIYQIYHYSRLAFCLFCALPPLVQISLWAHLLVAVALFKFYIGQNLAWRPWFMVIGRLRALTTHENTGSGHYFYSIIAKCKSIPKPPYENSFSGLENIFCFHFHLQLHKKRATK
jgi:hypothetical protein